MKTAKLLTGTFLILFGSSLAAAQKCDVDSGFRGNYFRVGYEQRGLVKVFRNLDEERQSDLHKAPPEEGTSGLTLREVATLPGVKISAPRVDAEHVTHYVVQSPYQSGSVTLRVIAPPSALDTESQRILFVLPVEPREENHFGDGLREIIEHGLHVKYGLIVVAPSFEFWPWYADHPKNAGRRQESYFLKVIVPLVGQLYPSKHQHRLLLGFSKSGWGALSLILRHPTVFEGAYAWDAPLMMAKPDKFEMPEVFVTQKNFEKYRISTLLSKKARYFRKNRRLGISGYSLFGDQIEQAHGLMVKLGIQHYYAEGSRRDHTWGSGWLEEAVSSLVGMAEASAFRR